MEWFGLEWLACFQHLFFLAEFILTMEAEHILLANLLDQS